MINVESRYQATIIDHGVSTTRESGLPQWNATFLASEIWDDDVDVYVDMLEPEQIDGYFVLISKAGKDIFHIKNIMKATGWDGKSFGQLAMMDLSDIKVQIMVECPDPEYGFKVTQIAAEGEAMGGGIRKLDAKALKALDARFRRTPIPTAASAKTRKPTVPAKAEAKVEPAKTAGPPARKPAGLISESELTSDQTPKEQSWEIVSNPDLRVEGLTDDQVGDIWYAAIDKVGKGKPEDKITEKQWAKITDLAGKQTLRF